jgi:asparagine synthetase B (glutamine-hydrolysing)
MMPHTARLTMSETLPAEDKWEQDFFLGAWNPGEELQVDYTPPPGLPPHAIRSERWFLAGTTSPLHTRLKSLVHAASPGAGELDALAFRGYLLDPPLNTWSEASALLRYWANPPESHNGLCAAARILEGGRRLQLITDAFGIAPLYYRIWNGAVLFSTLPRLLAAPGDHMDRLAGRSLIQTGYLAGDFSLTCGIERVPPGRCLTFDGVVPASRAWFRYGDLPVGDQPITPAAVREVEEAFQNAIDRCLRLPAASYVLPLSSGYDSRRILAALHSRGVPFQALTVRVFQKGGRDLDASSARAMASEFGFSHTVLELPEPAGFAKDDRLRRRLTDSEVVEHTWAIQLARHLPPQTSLVFDGLGGDVLNNTSAYGGQEFHTAAEPEKVRLVARRLIGAEYDKILNEKFWPGGAELREALIAYLRDLPEGPNRSDLAFLLLRARRGAGVWSHTLIPAGHVPVHPYFDRDYVRIALRYDPLEKRKRSLQERCLAEFWPRYYAYPGSRRLPPDSAPGDPGRMGRLDLACLRQLLAEADSPLFHGVRPWLKARGYALLLAAAHEDRIASRLRWWLYPLLSLQARNSNQIACWRTGRENPALPAFPSGSNVRTSG